MGTINDKIRELRESLGLSQDAFGELCGFRQNEISRYEAAKKSPRFDIVCQIVHACDISCDKFWESCRAEIALPEPQQYYEAEPKEGPGEEGRDQQERDA